MVLYTPPRHSTPDPPGSELVFRAGHSLALAHGTIVSSIPSYVATRAGMLDGSHATNVELWQAADSGMAHVAAVHSRVQLGALLPTFFVGILALVYRRLRRTGCAQPRKQPRRSERSIQRPDRYSP